jgi:hypothetical protein
MTYEDFVLDRELRPTPPIGLFRLRLDSELSLWDAFG